MLTPIDFGKEFLDAFYHKQDADAALSFLADDLVYVSQDEVYHFRTSKEIYAYLKTAVGSSTSSYVDIISIKSPPGASDTVTVVYEVNIVPKEAASGEYRRILLVIRRDSAQEIICVDISASYSATLSSALNLAVKTADGNRDNKEITDNKDDQDKKDTGIQPAVSAAVDDTESRPAEKRQQSEEFNTKITELSLKINELETELSKKEMERMEAETLFQKEMEELKEQNRQKEEDIKRQAQTELDLYQAQLRGESASRQARKEMELSSRYLKKERELAESYGEKERELAESYGEKERELTESFGEKEKEFRIRADGFEEDIRKKDNEIKDLDLSLEKTRKELEETRAKTDEEKKALEAAIEELKRETIAAGDRMEILRNENRRQESLYAQSSALRDSADAEIAKVISRIERLYRSQEVPVFSKRYTTAFEHLLDMARVTAGREPLREKEFSLDDSMNTLYTVLSSDIRQGGNALQLELPDKKQNYCGDPARLLQILFNIMEEIVLPAVDAPDGNAVHRSYSIKIAADRPVRGRTYLNFTIADPDSRIKEALASDSMEVTTRYIGMMGGALQYRTIKGPEGQDSSLAILKLNLKIA